MLFKRLQSRWPWHTRCLVVLQSRPTPQPERVYPKCKCDCLSAGLKILNGSLICGRKFRLLSFAPSAFSDMAIADHSSIIFLLSFQPSIMFFSKSKSHVATVPLIELTAWCSYAFDDAGSAAGTLPLPSSPSELLLILKDSPYPKLHLRPVSDQNRGATSSICLSSSSSPPPHTHTHAIIKGLLGSSHYSNHFTCVLI